MVDKIPHWSAYARQALQEDRADDDVTTGLLGRRAARPAVGRLRAEGGFVVAGLPLADAVFRELDASAVVEEVAADGRRVGAGDVIATVRGPGGILLGGERVVLNFLQRLSGIATATRRAVEAVAGTGSVITDTRKTTPGLRELEKYAVRIGGGENHRTTLADAVLWKDNHWQLLGGGRVTLAEVLRDVPGALPVCIEVEDEHQLEVALEAGATWILADNQAPATIAAWSRRAGQRVTIEASGGITPETARSYAEAGARRISIGALTYAPDPAPISFEIGVE